MTSDNVPSPPTLGELGPSDLASRGRRYATERHVKAPLRIGYGNERLPDGSNFWGRPSYVVVLGHVDAGGPRLLAGACPISTGKPFWRPVIERSDDYVYEGRTIDFIAMVAAVATGGLLIQPAVELLDTNPKFHEWLGFLVELSEHPEGIEV